MVFVRKVDKVIIGYFISNLWIKDIEVIEFCSNSWRGLLCIDCSLVFGVNYKCCLRFEIFEILCDWLSED